MQTKDFLLEIGVEEIPAGYIKQATKKLHDHFATRFSDLELTYNKLKIFSTPRRFALLATELQTKQLDITRERIGPSQKAAYDEKGNLTRAAQGFLRSAGAQVEDIYLVETDKGQKIAVKFEKKGLETIELLKTLIPPALESLPFPRKMKWKKQDLSFARPIRWLLSLFGDTPVELEYKSLRTGNYTYGNRFISLEDKLEINRIDDYEKMLADHFVIADRGKRKETLVEKIELLISNSGFKLIPDNALLETVTDLVEHPQPVLAEFDKRYLDLPEKLITTTLSEHQKYFSLADDSGKLTNKFLFVSNGNPKYDELIKLGNEKVIKARLDDAEFFYNEDLKIPLDDYVERLTEVTFQKKLGSVLEKTRRIENIAAYLSDLLILPDFVKAKTIRVAQLCKADLVTLMLGEKEFTKLQGYIGWKYAEENGEKHPVPLAIYEHYLPRWPGDRLPDSIQGAIVAVADKLDTICGIIGVGMLPTGSKDPFALRRAANGVIQIIAEKGFEINLKDLIKKVFDNLEAKLADPLDNFEFVLDFMKQRINWFLQEKGIDYDIIDSVMHIDHNYVPDLLKRATALQELKSSSSFLNLVTGFKRVSNIIETYQAEVEFQEELLQEEAEIKLYREFLELKEVIDEILKVKEYDKILKMLIAYGKSIDVFFDNVLVNVENTELRNNRYELLLMIRKLFLKVADLSKLVLEGN